MTSSEESSIRARIGVEVQGPGGPLTSMTKEAGSEGAPLTSMTKETGSESFGASPASESSESEESSEAEELEDELSVVSLSETKTSVSVPQDSSKEKDDSVVR